ncbi:MAG: anti-sigma factor family protein [Limisphaerales bacterium]
MKCDEVQTLHGPYLDSELDARTSLEIEQHLKACPACACLFAEEEKLETRIKAALKQGTRTPALWAQIEREVAAAASSASRPRPPAQVSPPVGWPAMLGALWGQLRAGWQASRWAWAGLAAVWAVILVLNGVAREPDAPLVASQDLPSASELRLALKQKDLLLAELALTPEPAAKPKPALPSPRSDRRKKTLNS